MKLRARAAAVNLWTSPADRRTPFGACGQPVDNALGRVVIDRAFRRALSTGCPHSRTSRPQPHSFSNKFFFSKKREGPHRKKGTFLLCVDRTVRDVARHAYSCYDQPVSALGHLN